MRSARRFEARGRALGRAAAALCLCLVLSACGAQPTRESTPPLAPELSPLPSAVPTPAATEAITEVETQMLCLKIEDAAVTVDWEDNASVEALRKLCRDGALTVSLSRYGGFEQVGAIGTELPRSDSQTTTGPGDVVLYAGSHLVLFYGSNTWAYTRLGHITDPGAEELAALLGQGDVTVTLSLESAG